MSVTSDTASGIVALDDHAVLRITGSAARDFLGRQLTCDIEALRPERAISGAWLTPKGRVLTLLTLLDAGDASMRAIVPDELSESIIRRMQMFVLREDVEVERATSERVSGLVGQTAEQARDTVTRAGGGVLIADLVRIPPLSLLVAPSQEHDRSLQALLADGAPRLSRAAWDLLQVRAGLPRVVTATQEEFIPQMINLDRLGQVSFSKGCYPGQEIVARTQHLGRIKRRAFLARCDDPQPLAQPGDTVVAEGARGGARAGQVVLSAPSPGDEAQEMLVVLPLDAVTAGGRFRLRSASGPLLSVSAPPYGLDETSR